MHEKTKHHAIGGKEQECYRRVRNALHDRYEQPHVMGRHCKQLLLDLPKINQYDGDGLEIMATLMKRCLSALEESPEFSTLNTVGFITTLVKNLPVELRRKWISVTQNIETKTSSLAGFEDFAKFVINEYVVVIVVNNLFHEQRKKHKIYQSKQTIK